MCVTHSAHFASPPFPPFPPYSPPLHLFTPPRPLHHSYLPLHSDNDDGSAYYNSSFNFMYLSGNGMKSDFG